jgi:gas vesicle protein
MKSGKILLGLLAGVAVGATMGILFAPDKGSNTRKKISKKGEDFAEELKDKFNDLVDNVKHRYETTKSETEELIENGKAKVEQVKGDLKYAVNEKANNKQNF